MTLYVDNKADPTEWDWFLEEKSPGLLELNWFINDEQDVKSGDEHFSETDLYTYNDITVVGDYTILSYMSGKDHHMTILKTSKRVTGVIRFHAWRHSSYTVTAV